jgi:ATP-dependent DNA ligase
MLPSRLLASNGCMKSSTIARKDGKRVRLYSRPGNDLTHRFPLIVEAMAKLRPRSCILDGEAICCDDDGLPSTGSDTGVMTRR